MFCLEGYFFTLLVFSILLPFPPFPPFSAMFILELLFELFLEYSLALLGEFSVEFVSFLYYLNGEADPDSTASPASF